MSTARSPNLCGCQPRVSALWWRHEVAKGETLAHLALKYDTTIGRICRANRMHPQDCLQTRRHIWLPVHKQQQQQQEPLEMEMVCEFELPARERALPNYESVSLLPTHFYRQSAPNLDDFASDCDPLLITIAIEHPAAASSTATASCI